MKYQSQSKSALTALLIATSALAGACSSGGAEPGSTGSAATTSAGTTSAATTSGAGGAGGGESTAQGTGGAGGTGGMDVPQPMRKTLSGDVTWKVTFDADAQAAGATDCSYTRHYEAREDTSARWLCPECEVMYLADVQMTAGATDCYPQVSSGKAATSEWLGYGGGKWWRSGGGPMTDQGTITLDATTLTTTNSIPPADAPNGGKLTFDVTGSLAVGQTAGDPRNGWIPPTTPYACGWPKADPPPYTGDYSLKVKGTVPDGLFHDACGETVRLHDFKGQYFIVDMSAIDCPPCQAMAGQEEQLIADLAAQGIKATVITLLAPSLSNTVGLTTTKMLNAWINKFSLKTPVLADRGWGLSVFGPALGDQIGYPSLAVVNPNLKVIKVDSGFGNFDEIKAAIVADAN